MKLSKYVRLYGLFVIVYLANISCKNNVSNVESRFDNDSVSTEIFESASIAIDKNCETDSIDKYDMHISENDTTINGFSIKYALSESNDSVDRIRMRYLTSDGVREISSYNGYRAWVIICDSSSNDTVIITREFILSKFDVHDNDYLDEYCFHSFHFNGIRNDSLIFSSFFGRDRTDIGLDLEYRLHKTDTGIVMDIVDIPMIWDD